MLSNFTWPTRIKKRVFILFLLFLNSLFLTTNAQTFSGGEQSVDVFIWEYPSCTVVDLDNDNDFDIFKITSTGSIVYIENEGTATSPDFGAGMTNPWGITNDFYRDVVDPINSIFVDIDNDSDKDLFVRFDSLYFFENIGDADSAVFDSAIVNPFGSLTDSISIISLTDFDSDSDFDIIGFRYNEGYSLYYIENTGTLLEPEYTTTRAYPINSDSSTSSGLVSAGDFRAVDFDNDGDADIVTVGFNSSFLYFENSSSSSEPFYEDGILQAFDLTYSIWGGDISSADFDADGDIDMLFVSYLSSGTFVYMLYNDLISSSTDVAYERYDGEVRIYPSLVENYLYIDGLNNGVSCESIEIFTLSGTAIDKFNQVENNAYDVSYLKKGYYLLKVNYGDSNFKTLRFIKN